MALTRFVDKTILPVDGDAVAVPRYRLTDMDGNVIADNVKIDLLNDVLVNGTPYVANVMNPLVDAIEGALPRGFKIGNATLDGSDKTLTQIGTIPAADHNLKTYTTPAQLGITLTASTTVKEVLTALAAFAPAMFTVYSQQLPGISPPIGLWGYGYTTFFCDGYNALVKFEGSWVNAGKIAYANVAPGTFDLNGWVIVKEI